MTDSDLQREQQLAMIWAMDRTRCIGRDGGLPWHYPEDLKFFKRETLDHVLIMGRKTWESFRKPLPRRTHVVLTRDQSYVAKGAEVLVHLEDALEYAWFRDHKPFVIGGAAIYELAMPYATELLITHINAEHEGDTYFPAYDESEWKEVSCVQGESPDLRFARYKRKCDGSS